MLFFSFESDDRFRFIHKIGALRSKAALCRTCAGVVCLQLLSVVSVVSVLCRCCVGVVSALCQCCFSIVSVLLAWQHSELGVLQLQGISGRVKVLVSLG